MSRRATRKHNMLVNRKRKENESVGGATTILLLNSTNAFICISVQAKKFSPPIHIIMLCLYNCIVRKKSIHHDTNTQRTNGCLLSAINNRDCATLSFFHTVVVIMAANGPDNVPSQSLGKSRASLWLLVLRLLSTRMKKKTVNFSPP